MRGFSAYDCRFLHPSCHRTIAMHELPIDPPTSLRRQARQRARSAARSVAHNDRRRRPSGSLLPGVAPGRCARARRRTVLPTVKPKCCPVPSNRPRTVAQHQDHAGSPGLLETHGGGPKEARPAAPAQAKVRPARSRPPTRRSSTASSRMVEATRARRRRPRRRIDEVMMCLWPRLN